MRRGTVASLPVDRSGLNIGKFGKCRVLDFRQNQGHSVLHFPKPFSAVHARSSSGVYSP